MNKQERIQAIERIIEKILIADINSKSDGTMTCERFDFPVFHKIATALEKAIRVDEEEVKKDIELIWGVNGGQTIIDTTTNMLAKTIKTNKEVIKINSV